MVWWVFFCSLKQFQSVANSFLDYFFQAQLQKEEGQNWLELHAKLEKLEMLEKECLKLTATQRIAEVGMHGMTVWKSCGIILWHTISSTKFCKITSVKAYLTECHLGFMCVSLYSVWTLKVPAVQFYPHITIVSSSRLLIQHVIEVVLIILAFKFRTRSNT